MPILEAFAKACIIAVVVRLIKAGIVSGTAAYALLPSPSASAHQSFSGAQFAFARTDFTATIKFSRFLGAPSSGNGFLGSAFNGS